MDRAIKERNSSQKELQIFAADKVIWDIDNLSKQPPWRNNISEDITDLSSYFVTVFLHALEKAKEVDSDIEIVSI